MPTDPDLAPPAPAAELFARAFPSPFAGPFPRPVPRQGQPEDADQNRPDSPPIRPESKGDDGRKPDYGPELICRTFAGDVGGRPLASGLPFWESPSIWVVAPDGGGDPIAGAANKVHVLVENLGSAPTYGAVVELYWCDPSVGVNLANAHPIGAPLGGISLAAGAVREFTFDWTPEFVNGGHECLVAQVYDPVADNLVAPFNPVQDRHVAQRNISHIRVPAGHQMDLHFFAANLSGRAARSELAVERVTGAALQGLGRGMDRQLARAWLAEAGGGHSEITQVEVAKARPRLDLGAHPVAAVFRETLAPPPLPYGRTMLHGAATALRAGAADPPPARKGSKAAREAKAARPMDHAVSRVSAQTISLDLPPQKELRLTITLSVPAEARRGSYAAYRVVETAEGRLTGGITYLVEVG